jgi:hypothetical protein
VHGSSAEHQTCSQQQHKNTALNRFPKHAASVARPTCKAGSESPWRTERSEFALGHLEDDVRFGSERRLPTHRLSASTLQPR